MTEPTKDDLRKIRNRLRSYERKFRKEKEELGGQGPSGGPRDEAPRQASDQVREAYPSLASPPLGPARRTELDISPPIRVPQETGSILPGQDNAATP